MLQTNHSIKKIPSILVAALMATLVAGPAAAVDTTPEAAADLTAMAEEEKLARDVYAALQAEWNLSVFARIGKAEQQHLDELLVHLDAWGLDDPTDGMAPGEFQDPEFAVLYRELVERGRTSPVEALRVGAAVEEIDLLDLRSAVEQTTDDELAATYERLMAGTRNHLRAFVRNLDREGVDYQPQYLEDGDYAAIIADGHERPGRKHKAVREGRGNGRGNGRGDGQGDGRGHRGGR
jgi:hypothetical protein